MIIYIYTYIDFIMEEMYENNIMYECMYASTSKEVCRNHINLLKKQAAN